MRSLVWEELDKALAELPDEQCVVFELNELQNFSFKEISESTGIPVNTLISRKRYAILYSTRNPQAITIRHQKLYPHHIFKTQGARTSTKNPYVCK